MHDYIFYSWHNWKKVRGFVLEKSTLVSAWTDRYWLIKIWVNLALTNNGGQYTAHLELSLQLNSDYILIIITQNSVGASSSGPLNWVITQFNGPDNDNESLQLAVIMHLEYREQLQWLKLCKLYPLWLYLYKY